MAQFDIVLWTKKAHALKRGTLASRLAAVGGLHRAVAWAKRQGIDVDFRACNGAYGLCLYDSGAIFIDPKLTLETQLHVLLHECGHVLVHRAPRLKRDWPRGYSAVENGFSQKGYRHMIAVLVEEIEAWNKGRKLAARLGIILTDAFEKTRDRLLKSHIESAL